MVFVIIPFEYKNNVNFNFTRSLQSLGCCNRTSQIFTAECMSKPASELNEAVGENLGDGLREEQQLQLDQSVQKWEHVFSRYEEDYGHTDQAQDPNR